jgi:hypothetical protein
VSYSEPFPRYSHFTVEYTVHCTGEQHAMSSHELQSALMLAVEFSNFVRPRHSSSGLSVASHRGGPGSSPGVASGICGKQCGAGAGFLRVLRFPLPIFIPPDSPSSNHPGRYNRPFSGRRAEWTQYGLHPPTMRIKKIINYSNFVT